MSRLAVIDNYDSFTYNIVQYLFELGADVEVYRNDQLTVDELEAKGFTAILFSPGPSNPDSAGMTLEAIERFAGKLPLFGVCLGHQSIGQHFGADITHAKEIMHGKLSLIYHNNTGVFSGLPNPFTATRYHSLVIAPESLPACLEVTAWTQNEAGEREEIMGVRHRNMMIEGVQFHPESISSEHGHALFNHFLVEAGIVS